MSKKYPLGTVLSSKAASSFCYIIIEDSNFEFGKEVLNLFDCHNLYSTLYFEYEIDRYFIIEVNNENPNI